MEVWKDIKGYEGIYKISNKGRVKNKKGELLNSSSSNGYQYIGLNKEGKRKNKCVHRLVAQAFIDNYSENLDVNHKDFNRSNNNVENLECVTRGENFRYSYYNNRVPLPPPQEPKSIICITDNKIFSSIKEASDYYKINCSLICNQLKGRHKHTHGKTFKYIEEV